MSSFTQALGSHRATRGFGGVISALPRLLALRRQRQRLLALDAHLLQDIGLTRDMALAEAARPIWDAPAHWQG